ncbi:VOC family protein [Streptomyces sp. NPDC021622]|uniref:VOC family protein n=1 Tax=Streptomyces sp. NPDC021622 TaxID=3155013 RepID=UPI0033D0A756
MTATSSTPAPALDGTILCHAMWARDGRELADFYAAALGTEVSRTYPGPQGEPAACAFDVGPSMYLFYSSENFTAPNWPEEELPFHMDLTFSDVRAAEERLLGMGATKPDHQPGGTYWTVLLDPSGQPFCIHQAR